MEFMEAVKLVLFAGMEAVVVAMVAVALIAGLVQALRGRRSSRAVMQDARR